MSNEPAEPRPLDSLSDAELIQLALARGERDDRPFAELFRRHRTFIWRMCISYFGNAQDAEDLTQEVFFAAFRKLRQFRGEASFRTWLRRITANRCKNELRRRSRRLKTVDEPIEEAAALAKNGSPGPEAVVVGGRGLRRLATALDALRPEDRRLLRLVEVDNLPYKDVAAALGLSPGATKMRVLRARLALREAFRAVEKGRPS